MPQTRTLLDSLCSEGRSAESESNIRRTQTFMWDRISRLPRMMVHGVFHSVTASYATSSRSSLGVQRFPRCKGHKARGALKLPWQSWWPPVLQFWSCEHGSTPEVRLVCLCYSHDWQLSFKYVSSWKLKSNLSMCKSLWHWYNANIPTQYGI